MLLLLFNLHYTCNLYIVWLVPTCLDYYMVDLYD
jgi:hypothetical protein